MYSEKRGNFTKKLLLTFPLLLALPLLLTFDSLTYFISRPSCLSCGNLVEFLKNGSLTMFLIGSAGYQLVKKT